MIKKIEKKIEVLDDVQVQGCMDDCYIYTNDASTSNKGSTNPSAICACVEDSRPNGAVTTTWF